MTAKHHLLLGGLLWLLVALAGCSGQNGRVQGIFVYDTDVASMTLTGIGVSVTSALPDLSRLYDLTPGTSSVIWTTSSAAKYAHAVTVEVDPGKAPRFFPLESGADGVDKVMLFYFSGSTVSISDASTVYTGVAQ